MYGRTEQKIEIFLLENVSFSMWFEETIPLTHGPFLRVCLQMLNLISSLNKALEDGSAPSALMWNMAFHLGGLRIMLIVAI